MEALFNRFVIRMTKADALSGGRSGRADEAVAVLVRKPQIRRQLNKIGPARIREELQETGAWDDDDLRDDDANRRRIVWVAARNIKEDVVQRGR